MINLPTGNTGAFLMREVLHDPSGEKIVGVAEEVLRLEDGDVYGADAALRCDNSWGITHGRDLSAFPFNKKILTPMIEVPPGGMDAYVTALAEGLSYLNDDEYEIDAKYETAERKTSMGGGAGRASRARSTSTTTRSRVAWSTALGRWCSRTRTST